MASQTAVTPTVSSSQIFLFCVQARGPGQAGPIRGGKGEPGQARPTQDHQVQTSQLTWPGSSYSRPSGTLLENLSYDTIT